MQLQLNPMKQPVPAADADDLSWGHYAVQAEQLYGAQKTELRAALVRLAIDPHATGDRARAATLLHMIAGTAAYFDDDMLGDRARADEYLFQDAADTSLIPARCIDLVAMIDAPPY